MIRAVGISAEIQPLQQLRHDLNQNWPKVLEWLQSIKDRLQHLFLVLANHRVFPLTGFSPKFHSPHHLNFGVNLCQFM